MRPKTPPLGGCACSVPRPPRTPKVFDVTKYPPGALSWDRDPQGGYARLDVIELGDGEAQGAEGLGRPEWMGVRDTQGDTSCTGDSLRRHTAGEKHEGGEDE